MNAMPSRSFRSEVPAKRKTLLLDQILRLALSVFRPERSLAGSLSHLMIRLFVLLGMVQVLGAFSPYEEWIARNGSQRVGLIAAVKPGADEALAKVLADAPANLDASLRKAGILNFSVFTKPIDGKTWCFAHFQFTGEREAAIKALESTTPFAARIAANLEPHPRAKGTWLRMEWITLVPGDHAKSNNPVTKAALVTGLKPEKEAEYRSLHQTNWPGVSDQIARSHTRDWTTFLVEIGDKLYLFSYYEYVGSNKDADDAAMKADPTTQRWWKLTDACQAPLPEVEGKGIWAEMKALRLAP
jgi:L-rhamnose mutarotase